MVNSVLHLSGVRFQFTFGLGIAQLVDALARRAGGASFALDILINGFLVGVFIVFFNFARQGRNWAFRAGMILYALDGLLMLFWGLPRRCISGVRALLDEWRAHCDFQTEGTQTGQSTFRRPS